jgi:GMP synthase-like glutamine amidotransferase
MKVAVVQNYPNVGLGQIETALNEVGAEIVQFVAFEGAPLPASIDGLDALIVLGGAQNARDDEGALWLPALTKLMRDFADSGRSVLGICLGSQLLARAYGADNLIGQAPEFGWRTVALTPEGNDDPVLGAAGASFPIFQWHDDTFTLPRHAVRLAGNEAAHNQAFRVGRAGYGMQFHFEADRKLVDEWSAEFAETIARRWPDWEKRRVGDGEQFGPAADVTGLAIARAWVGTIHKSA